MTILHIDSSILGEGSVSRKLSAETVARLIAAAPETEVVYRDLAAYPISLTFPVAISVQHNPCREA